MGDSELNLSKLTASLEELSLRKQLPLRQQAQKPVLKYNTTITKPVHLFSQSDVVSLRRERQRESSPSPPSRQAAVNGALQSRRSNHSLSPVRSNASSVSSNSCAQVQQAKPNGNPYARPVSAKEVAEDILGHTVKKNPSTSSVSSISNASNGVLQLNSFMRPQSAAMKEKFDQATKKATSARKNKQKLEKTAATEIFHDLNRNEVHLENGYDLKSGLQNGHDKLLKKPPVGKQDVRGHKSGHATEIKKVRNLNYTPTRPYSEVSDTDSDSPKDSDNKPSSRSVIISHAKASSPTRSVPPQTVPVALKPTLSNKHSSRSPQSLTATTTMNSDMSTLGSANGRKMPVTNTVTGTVYYKKGSKAEEIIHEQRPKADGAPAVPKKITEKDAEEEDGEDEYEDEGESDICSPSGERLPGDGEASYDDDLDEEDDGIDGLDDDCVGSDIEGESDGFSVASSLSRHSTRSFRSNKRPTTSLTSNRPAHVSEERQKTFLRPVTASTSDSQPKPALRPSLFPNIPPTINFVSEGEKVEQLPWDIRKLLKWRMSPITPNIVKSALSRIGFRITKKNHDWLGCFGKHMKSQGFKAIREYQKLNHFPGSFQIGRKDRLWRNLSKMQVHFGKREFGFFPQTYVLPQDLKLLKRAWEDGGSKQKWIIKPPASARGIGIKVIHKWTQIPRRRPVIVQRYLGRPYLINDSKFDMRVYVYVSCYDPLRIYIFEDGLARFASCKYSSSMKSLSNKFMHLTNYSVNKKNTEYVSNADDSVCQGHKWSLKALWNYLKRQGINTVGIWDSVKDLVVKTIISSEAPINSMIKSNVRSRYCVHELFGFDILLDDHLKPWILEVNISPSLHSNSQLDVNIKGQMIKDLMNIAGFRVPDKTDITHVNSSASCDLSAHVPSSDYCMDKRLYSQQFAPDERTKHAYYCQRHQDEQAMQTIMDTLTPNDVRTLTECIDEDSRKGGYQRIFPTPSTHKYLRLFEQPRYNNLLLDQWVQRFNRMEQRGIAMLQAFCGEGLHLENPTDSPSHQWNPPNSSIMTFRDSRMYSAPATKNDKLESNLKLSASTSQLPKVPRRGPRPLPPRSLSQTSSTSSLGPAFTPGSTQPSSPATRPGQPQSTR
ncbi:tubulin monoglutamylase TTLL4-like [Haliotis rufescens]|uniref:tubulin monoglutamylase TTLL4-like n=1 Tax=Haliotis rufescens TaxID=6454 RepID=UPI00201EF0F5|nr:tubulin monoglutamylase TTLL4-like [Haliotis rufescens]